MILQGQTYNHWTFTGETLSGSKKVSKKYKCICSCGNVAWLSHQKLINPYRSKQCKKCSIEAARTGYGDITGKQYAAIVYKAKKRNIEFSPQCTIQYLWDLFIKQDRICTLSGLPLVMKGYNKAKGNASLDRIDSSIGYIPGNVQWVDVDMQFMKYIFKQDFFIQRCGLVTRYNESKIFRYGSDFMCGL